jgi:hypothetical protein
MDNNIEETEFWRNLEIRMQHYSEEELTDVLKRRKHYEPEAVRIAVAEALKRGLINSGKDLDSDRFAETPSRFTLFPCSERPEIMRKVIRSLSRALLVAGVIPVIFGVLKFQLHKYAEGGAMVMSGLIWIAAAWMVYRRQERIYWTPLLVIAILAALYAIRILLLIKGLRTMDYVIPGVLFGVVFYTIFYLRAVLNKWYAGNQF